MMEIHFTGRNIEVDDEVKKYIQKRLGKFDRLYSRIYRCDVILEEEKIRKNVEMILHLKRNQIIAKESSTDMYASIDNAIETLKKQLTRLSGKIRAKRRKSVFKSIIGPVIGMRDEYEEYPSGKEYQPIVKMDLYANKPMLPEEARVELEVMGKNFIMFKNSDTGEPNVLYKRTDGTFGLIEPKF